MLKVDPNVPLKQTHTYLAGFPRFSLIEKIAPKFFPTSIQASRKVAEEIRDAIKAKAQKTKDPFVLGLATGSTPLKVYKQLIKMVKNGQLSFKNVVTFNLDQYYPITKDNIESYNYYMRQNLFNHVDIPPENINIPDGEIPREMVSKFCDDYEKKIKSFGGIDLQILGIGRTGHIGFNEPPSPIKSTTRLVYLHRLTRKDAANAFNGIDNVPKCAITMGIQTISKAKRIIIMAWGQNKAYIVKKSIEGPQTNDIPSTFLHNHPDAVFYLDKGAGEQLSRFKIPWTIKGDKQDPIVPNTKYWILKMIFWLSREVKKPILRLSFEDYEDHGLSPLIMDVAKGHVEDLNLFAYKQLHSKITGWPLGDRPTANTDADSNPVKENFLHKTSLKRQRVLVFSPHPDDDVISMGGTIHRLKDQGHHVMIAYMTTGSNAVHDYEATKYLHFMKDFLKYNKKVWSIQDENSNQKSAVAEVLKLLNEAEQNLFEKKSDSLKNDNDVVRNMKGLIRSSEAKIAVESFGILPKDVYCMELPFYTHHSKRKDIGEEDKQILRDLLKVTEPTVIYAAGDLTDPHGTHRKCLQIILQVQVQEVQKSKKDPLHNSLFPHPQKIFFYRGAWEEWDLAMCRVIVPMSPSQVEQKIAAILKHQSQKDAPMFPGDDKRQFWMRSKERNRNTAAELRDLGFSDYEAVECFVNLWDLINYEEF